jgi:predicted dehydrogenase
MPEERRLRVAVVGLNMGAEMLAALAAHPRAQVVAICDTDKPRLDTLAKKYGVARTYRDYQQMLDHETFDGICISTPNRLHAPMARVAMERGLHVMCEKPLAMDTEEAQDLLRLARRKGITHAVNFSNRPNPAVRFVKELIDAGTLGHVNQAHIAYLQDWLSDASTPYSWRNSLADGGPGALGDIASHVLDLGRLFLGEIAAVSAQLAIITAERAAPDGSLRRVDADDLVDMHVRFRSGTLASVRASRVARGYGDYRRVELYGERASLILELNVSVIRVLRADEATRFTDRDFRTVFAYDARNGGSIWTENTVEWVDAALEGRQMSPSFEDGMRCQQVIDAAVKSDAERRWIDLPAGEPS